MSLRIGTRGSALALVQTEKVAGMLADRGIETEIITIT
ncbi:MAG: hydroxymethylbilane synthase, partial [Methanomicrobiales archaeon]|nr:hydroxymethylbilane synthase [Methanomicrobiales archaeon]